MNTHFHFYCKPKKDQRIETVLQVERDQSALIHGVVKDPAGAPIAGALLLLFSADENRDIPLAQAHTDPEGHFAFWGLAGDVLYQIKLFQEHTDMREITLNQSPD